MSDNSNNGNFNSSARSVGDDSRNRIRSFHSRQNPRSEMPSNNRGPRPAGTSSAMGRRPANGPRPMRNDRNGASGNRRSPIQRGKNPGPGPGGFSRSPIGPEDNTVKIPPVEKGVVRIIPLGGVEEIGRNMTAIEIGDDIIVVDAGFQFKDEDSPGIDYILPNTRYLEERQDKIRALFITHGHLDHIGGIPYLIDRIGYPTVYTRQFGAIMIKKRQEEFPHLKELDIKVIDGDETMRVGNIKVKTFPISHTIPDSMGLIIETDYGNIVFIEDVRVDNMKGIPTDKEVEQYQMFKNMNVLLLTMDSTSIEKPGFSLSENVVAENIERFIKETHGRLIIGTFASQVERILAIIKSAEKYNKKIVVEGRSMKANLEIIKYLKLADITNVVPVEDIENYPPDRIVMLVTGAQGEEFAALMRMTNKTHKYVHLKKTDTVLLSSSIIPTNHKAIVRLKDNLYRSEAKVITYLDSDIHASGHGNRDELKWIHNQIKYKFFMPVHGNHYMLCQHAELAQSISTPKENIVIPDNGSVIEIYEEGQKIRIRKEKAPSDMVTVDGFAVGDMKEVVIRDRLLLAEEGMFVVVAMINTTTGKLRKSPDIISRGFVYLRESQDLLSEARLVIKRTIESSTQGSNPINFDLVKGNVTDAVSRFLFQKTAKHPIIIPVILGV